MITISQFDSRYLALRNCFDFRARIKMLADYPDVMWSAEAQAWLVDSRLYEELALAVGKWLQGAPDFWLTFTEYEPSPAQPRRRTRQQILQQKAQDKAAAGRFGRVIVEYMNQGDTK